MRSPRKERAAAALTLIVISAAFLLTAIAAPAHASTVSLTGKYIMAFLACNTSASNCSSPQNHVTHLVESNDSVNWSPVPAFAPYSGSVPDAIRRGNTIYIYNPGLVVRFHLDTGVQSQPTTVSLKFGNGTSAAFVDPSLFLDSNGALHLFYLPGITGQDPAQCPTGQSTCTKEIMSATEVAGSDGGSFAVDSGTRASYTISQCCFSDPAVFQGPDGYYLYVSEGQAVIAFDSPTLTGNYATVQGLSAGLLVPFGTGGVPAGYYDNSSRMFWTFVSQGSSVQVIARASTSNINSQISSSSFSTILSGCNVAGLGCSYTVGSPGFHQNTPGPTTTSTTTTTTSTSSSRSSTISTSVSTTTSGATTSSSSTTTLSSSSTAATTQAQSSTTTTSTRSSSSPSTAVIPTSSSATTSTTSTTTTATTASTTSTTSTGGGGIPEFPPQLGVATIFTVLAAALYLLIGRHELSRKHNTVTKRDTLLTTP